MDQPSSVRDRLSFHIIRAAENFALFMFLAIHEHVASTRAPAGFPGFSKKPSTTHYNRFRDFVPHSGDALIIIEFILLLAAEIDLAFFQFRKTEDQRTQIQIDLVRHLEKTAGVKTEELAGVLGGRLAEYSRTICRSGATLPDEPLTEILILFICRTLGKGGLFSGQFAPAFHNGAALKEAYLAKGVRYHAAFRHYLYRILKTSADIVFVDEALYNDIFFEALSVAREKAAP